MFQITDILLFNYFKWRQRRIEKVFENPWVFQEQILKRILKNNRKSQYGMRHGFENIENYDQYSNSVPVVVYEDIFPFIQKMIDGEKNILTSETVNWFAKSSGTSNDRSKFIPVSANYLKKGHLKCAWDNASFIYKEDPSAKLFADKSLIMGGSIERLSYKNWSGDISAIILHHFPKIGRRFYTPDLETALMPKWDDKIKKIAEITCKQNVTLLAGVPTWTLVLIREILNQTGKSNISEVWPNLRSYLHGGVGFEPYREEFKKLIPSSKVIYREAYNASEGYFAMQNEKDEAGMLLYCNHEIYYEFIPYEDITKEQPRCINLTNVELNKNYAMVITNSSGLYRYRIGDVVQFVNIQPYKIKVVGREREFINVFGEEVSVHNTDKALSKTCLKFGIRIKEYSIAPIFMTNKNLGGHEWLVEFDESPLNLGDFEKELDQNLREINSDYDAKRSFDLALGCLKIKELPRGHFEKWLRSKNKYGGQNKVPRLRNDRSILKSILSCD